MGNGIELIQEEREREGFVHRQEKLESRKKEILIYADGVTFPTPKWNRGQQLVHVKTGGKYVVTEKPVDFKRLEYCNEPFYSYRSYGQETDHVIWHRRQSEMEDGRFVEEP